jgi:hypothetical protein
LEPALSLSSGKEAPNLEDPLAWAVFIHWTQKKQ